MVRSAPQGIVDIIVICQVQQAGRDVQPDTGNTQDERPCFPLQGHRAHQLPLRQKLAAVSGWESLSAPGIVMGRGRAMGKGVSNKRNG